MANLHDINIQGQINLESHRFTLSSGAVALKTKLKRWRPVGVVLDHATAVPGETVGVAGTPTDGWFYGATVNLDSSNGSSTATGTITIAGY